LLSNNPTSFNEDNDKFRNFFKNRFASLVRIRSKTPLGFKEMTEWLNSEVFVQQDDKGTAEIDEEQRAFEDELAQAISEESNAVRRRRELAVSYLQEGAGNAE
jgi:hypothetical protein